GWEFQGGRRGAFFRCFLSPPPPPPPGISGGFLIFSPPPTPPPPPRPQRGARTRGLRKTPPVNQVWNTDQPPFSTGSLVARRCTTEPQSVACNSTLMPIFLNMSWVMSPSGPIVGKSVGLMITAFWSW